MNPKDTVKGVNTLLSLDAHFDQLKKQSLDLKTRVDARQRGYFKPEEEEDTARLFISYVQARNALLESVLEGYQSGETQKSPHAFVLCLGGAMLLVDAAVFLKETFGDHPVIRAKLNEANPTFGIPSGTYDQIQKSLTDPANNWHLLQARNHFDQVRKELLAKAPECQPVIHRIDELSKRLKKSLKTYLKERLEVRRSELAKGLGTNLFGSLIYDVQKSFASMMATLSTKPGHQPGLPKEVDKELRQLLHPGDVLLTRKEFVFTNYFLPGYWPHGSLHLGSMDTLEELGLARQDNFRKYEEQLRKLDSNDPSRALEALKDGVHLRTLRSPLGADSIVVIRPELKSCHLVEAIDRVLQHAGKPYDFDFDFTRSDRMVCTEVIYRAYDGVGDLRFQLTKRAGRMTLSAMDLIHMALQGKHFKVVAAFIPKDNPKLLFEMDATQAIQSFC